MGTNVVQHNADKCPKCGSGLIEDLAEQNGFRRHTCRACGENFTTIIGSRHVGDIPGEPVARLPDDPRMKSRTPYKISRLGEARNTSPFSRTALEETNRKEATMAAKLKCEKCGKPYQRGGKKFDAHVSGCDGTPWKGEEKKPRKAKAAKKAPWQRGKKAMARAEASQGVTASIVAMLQDKRTQRIAELTAGDDQLQEIDRVLEALESRPI